MNGGSAVIARARRAHAPMALPRVSTVHTDRFGPRDNIRANCSYVNPVPVLPLVWERSLCVVGIEPTPRLGDSVAVMNGGDTSRPRIAPSMTDADPARDAAGPGPEYSAELLEAGIHNVEEIGHLASSTVASSPRWTAPSRRAALSTDLIGTISSRFPRDSGPWPFSSGHPHIVPSCRWRAGRWAALHRDALPRRNRRAGFAGTAVGLARDAVDRRSSS